MLNVDETAFALSEDATIDEFRKEMMQNEPSPIENPGTWLTKEENQDPAGQSLSEAMSNNFAFFSTFFEILNMQINELSRKAWNVLTHIPVNRKIYERIRDLYARRA